MLISKDILLRRRVVIHHTHLLRRRITDFLNADDIVFFDDCLFSQYNFLKENEGFFRNMNVDCVLGFSSGLYANEQANQIHEVESYALHDACNSKIKTIDDANRLRDVLPEMNGFMKVSQIKELLQLPFCHLALHGCCHLKLENHKKLLTKMQLFKKDLDDGCKKLKELGLKTDMYIYPYAYSFPTSDVCLKKKGFTHIIGSCHVFRLSIENLCLGKNNGMYANC